MGIEYSCLRKDLRLNKDEMIMKEDKKSAINQESIQGSDDSEIILDTQTIYQERKCDYIKIQSAARGYLVRREWSAIKERNIAKICKSKATSKNKIKDKQQDKIPPKSPSDDSLQASIYPVYTQLYGVSYDGDLNEKGEKHGEGIEIYSDGSKYIGSFEYNERCGNGSYISSNGNVYQGEFKNGQPNGKGIFHQNNGTVFKGDFQNGALNGEGTEEGRTFYYKGSYKNWLHHGQGLICFKDGSYYEGQFKEDKMDGDGHYVWTSDREYKGEWKDNKMHGKGVYIWPDGGKYEGDYVNNLKHGHGVFSFPDGWKYDGEYKNGLQDGEGFLTDYQRKIKKNLWHQYGSQNDEEDLMSDKMETMRGLWKEGRQIKLITLREYYKKLYR